MAQNINNIPSEDLKKMRAKVISQINSMNDDELKITFQSKTSLSKVIAGLFREIAFALGYIIALPLAYAAKIAESIWTGFSDGFTKAFDNIFDG